MKRQTDDDITEVLKRIHEMELAAIPSTEELELKYELSDLFYQKMERLLKKQRWVERNRLILQWVAMVGCVVILLFAVSHPNSIVQAYDYVMEWFEDHVSFRFREETELNKIPEYELGYVPEGYEIEMDVYYESGMGAQIYTNGENDISFDYILSDGTANMDNEGVVYQIIIGEDGTKTHYFAAETEEDESMIMWLSEDGNILFTITGNLQEEEFLKIQQNVVEKK